MDPRSTHTINTKTYIGVRWIEPVLQGTNPVILHPNALGESHMAARTMKVLSLP